MRASIEQRRIWPPIESTQDVKTDYRCRQRVSLMSSQKCALSLQMVWMKRMTWTIARWEGWRMICSAMIWTSATNKQVTNSNKTRTRMLDLPNHPWTLPTTSISRTLYSAITTRLYINNKQIRNSRWPSYLTPAVCPISDRRGFKTMDTNSHQFQAKWQGHRRPCSRCHLLKRFCFQ